MVVVTRNVTNTASGTPSASSSPYGRSGLGPGAISGIVVAVVVILLAASAIWFTWKRRHASQSRQDKERCEASPGPHVQPFLVEADPDNEISRHQIESATITSYCSAPVYRCSISPPSRKYTVSDSTSQPSPWSNLHGVQHQGKS